MVRISFMYPSIYLSQYKVLKGDHESQYVKCNGYRGYINIFDHMECSILKHYVIMLYQDLKQ